MHVPAALAKPMSLRPAQVPKAQVRHPRSHLGIRFAYASLGLGLAGVVIAAPFSGTLDLTPTVAAGQALAIKVTDADLNTDPASLQSVAVNVVNDLTGESETATLVETGPNNGVFTGSLATALNGARGADNDGVLHLRAANTATATYVDMLTDSGDSATLTAVSNATGGTDFFQNYLRSAYYLPIFPLDGAQFGGDLTAAYDQTYVPNRPNLELLIIGEFPRARYLAVTAYDDHGMIIDSLHDAELEPLRLTDGHPFRLGGPVGAEDTLYAVRVQLGDQLAQTPEPGCQFNGVDVITNVLDARFRHTATTRYTANQSGFSAASEDGTVTVVHDDRIENKGTSIIVRRYLAENDGQAGTLNLTTPLVFLRNATTGCAYNMFEIIGKTQTHPTESIKASDWFNFQTIMDRAQLAAHDQHEKDMGTSTPFGLDPFNGVAWYGGPEYILTPNPDTGYLAAALPQSRSPARLNADGRVMRFRFRLPKVPCAGRSCPVGLSEEVRYWSLSFVEGQRHVFATIPDLDLIPDAQGYVTLIVSFGTPIPARINADAGYSVANLPELPLRLLIIRNIVPAANFLCSLNVVPFYTNEHNIQGGYMGDYAPFVDYVQPASLPLIASPRVESGTCAFSG